MTGAEAEAAVVAIQAQLDIPADRRVIRSERMVVERWLDRTRAETHYDRIAWMVQFGSAEGLSDVFVDDETGLILFVRRRG